MPRPALFIALAAALLATAMLARAQQPRQATPDEVCAMVASLTKQGAGHAQVVPLLPRCAASAHCVAIRQDMISAMRADFDDLNCDQAPPLTDAGDACTVVRHGAEYLGYVARGGKLPLVEQGKQRVNQAIAALTPLCNKSPDPALPCQALSAFKFAELPNPGLVCNR